MELTGKVEELEEFYNENRRDMSFYHADEDPSTLLEYRNMVQTLVNNVESEYDEEVGETLKAELTPGFESQGEEGPNFESAHQTLESAN